MPRSSSTRSLPRVEELGRSLARAWSKAGRSIEAFPDLSLRALRTGALGRHLTVQQLLVWASEGHAPDFTGPRSELATRSFPLFEDEDFIVELLIWTDGPATLAGVAGALEILSGASLHCTGRSEREAEIAPAFFVGMTSRTQLDALRPGSKLSLDPGDRRFHLLAHFERPVTAILVRALVASAAGRRVRYLSPRGTASLEEPPALRRRFDALSTLRTLDVERFWEAWTGAAAGMDLPCLFLVLFRLCGERDRERAAEVLRKARATHGEKVDALHAVCEEHLRQATIVSRWMRARGKEHAFLFAVLLLAQDRPQVLAAIRKRYPRRDPLHTLVTWILQLARPDPSAGGRNGLDLPLNEVTTRVLELTVRGVAFERLVRALRRDFALGDGDLGMVRQAHDFLREHPLFRNLCAERRSRSR